MEIERRNIIGLVIGLAIVLILIGVLLPLGLDGLTDFTGAYNRTVIDGTETTYVTGTNATVGTLVSVILPIMIVIGIIVGFVSKVKDGGD